jgi:predicted transcriptional regulator of viral defense system
MNVVDLAIDNNGVVTSADAVAHGIANSRLTEAVSLGELVRLERGIYCLPETWEDDYLVAQLRFPKGVFSDGSALFLHDATDRTPERLTMTFPRGYNATGPRSAGIVVRTCSNEVLGLGVVSVVTPSGNQVRAYDVERSLCDMVRGRAAVDVQVLNPAMKAYMRSRIRNLAKLMDYAERLGVQEKVRTYVEVLL